MSWHRQTYSNGKVVNKVMRWLTAHCYIDMKVIEYIYWLILVVQYPWGKNWLRRSFQVATLKSDWKQMHFCLHGCCDTPRKTSSKALSLDAISFTFERIQLQAHSLSNLKRSSSLQMHFPHWIPEINSYHGNKKSLYSYKPQSQYISSQKIPP